MNDQKEEVLTRKEACQHLRISLGTFDNLKILHIKLKRLVLYRRSVLDQWIRENTVSGKKEV